MATGTIVPWLTEQFEDNTGSVLNAGTVDVYLAGTSTRVDTFTDVSLTTPHANPVVLNSAGRPQTSGGTEAPIYLTPGVSYKFVIKNSAGSTIITRDNITAIPPSSQALDVIGTAGENLNPNQAVYLSDGSGGKNAGQWYLADATNAYSSIYPEIGIATVAINTGQTGAIRVAGQLSGFSSLTIGARFFITTTPGTLSNSQPTSNVREVGQADSATEMVIFPQPSLVRGVVTLTDAATVALNAALGDIFRLVAAGNRTIDVPTNPVDGQKLVIQHKASGADRTLTLTTGSAGAFRFGTDITTLTATTSGKTDYIGCIYNGADSRWDVVAVIKGF